MLKRHKDQLLNRLEQCVRTQGWCIIEYEELRLWYGQKVTKNVWRDIKENLDALCEDAEINTADVNFAVYMADAHGNVLITDTKDLQPMSDLTA